MGKKMPTEVRILFCLGAGAIAAILLFHGVLWLFERNFEHIRRVTEEEAPAAIRELCIEKDPLIRDAQVRVSSSFYPKSYSGAYGWEEVYYATIYLADDFDSLSLEERHKFIQDYGDTFWKVKQEVLARLAPGHAAYQSQRSLKSKILGIRLDGVIRYEDTYRISFKTSRNIYAYEWLAYDYLWMNGRKVYLNGQIPDPVTPPGKKEDPVPETTERKPNYHYVPEEDPYNASDYRTAEQFYEAHYNDFFCFEDAEYYYYKHRND